MPVFFIHSKQISGNLLHLTGPLVKHLGGALRHKPGNRIFVVDEQKTGYVVELSDVKTQQIVGKILEVKKEAPTPRLKVTLGQGILKAKKMDWILQKATELGVSRIIPMITERIVAEPKPERTEHQQQRWEKILKEAAQQCGRWETPDLNRPTDFTDLVRQSSNFTLSLIPWEGESEKGLKTVLPHFHASAQIPYEVLALIGPEGGFSFHEIEIARRHGIIPISLGQRILRAETACLATLTMLQYEWGDMGDGHA